MEPRKISPVVQQAVDHYIDQSQTLNQHTENQSLQSLRAKAQMLFADRAFPTQKDEDWQYTKLRSFTQNHFKSQPAKHLTLEQVNQFLPDFPVTKVVFVDGWFNEALSDDLGALPKQASFESYADVTEQTGDFHKLYEHEDDVAKEPFGLLNSCLAADGFFFELEANATLETPLFILHIQTNALQSVQVRNRIDVDENAEMTIVERYVSLDPNQSEAAFTNVVTQIDVAKYARVRQIIMQEQHENAFYFNNQYVFQQDHSNFITFFGSTGSLISRHQNHLWMNGEHIETEQNSACLARNNQTVDSRTDTQHNDVWGLSQQLHKYVLADSSTGVFNGMIRVDQKAQKTDGQMDNGNLILSNKARMDTKPQLEIYADDVKCSHGSATGQIDDKQIFYMQARGINKSDAIRIITHAFLLEPTESISNDGIRAWVVSRLSNGLEKINH